MADERCLWETFDKRCPGRAVMEGHCLSHFGMMDMARRGAEEYAQRLAFLASTCTNADVIATQASAPPSEHDGYAFYMTNIGPMPDPSSCHA